MSPRRGGESDKLGARYEGVWTADAVLELILGRLDTMTVEPLFDSAGIEFVTGITRGPTTFHSVKRQKTGKDWSLADLTRTARGSARSIAGDLVKELRRSRDHFAVFVSATGANELRELTERASRVLDPEAFHQGLRSSEALWSAYSRHVQPLFPAGEREAHDCLRRLRVVLINESELIRRVEEKVAIVLAPTGPPAKHWATVARLQIVDFILDRLGQVLTAPLVNEELARRGFGLHAPPASGSAAGSRTEVELPLELPDAAAMPAGSPGHLLYWTRSIEFVGRDRELADLEEFAKDPQPFQWWLWTGPGGVGKSRIALELCLRLARDWRVGFLAHASEFQAWSRWRPRQPTLIVVDYCSSRADEIGLMLSSFAQSRFDHSVRVLLLEREWNTSWWNEFIHAESSNLRERILRCQYKEPHELAALEGEHLCSVVRSILAGRGAALGEAQLLEELRAIDPLGRPLFAALAGAALLNGRSLRRWDQRELVENVLAREDARWRRELRRIVNGEEEVERQLDLLAVVTLLGGTPSAAVERLAGESAVPGMLPGHSVWHLCTTFGRRGVGAELRPIEPDILGEAFVLERLLRFAPAGDRHPLVERCWRFQPGAAGSFMARALADFPKHEGIGFFLAPPLESARERSCWSLALLDGASTLALENPAGFALSTERLDALALAYPGETTLARHLAMARFDAGTELLRQARYEEANEVLTTAKAMTSNPAELQADIWFNLGLALWGLADAEGAEGALRAASECLGGRAETRAKALHDLAIVCYVRGGREEALQLLSNLASAEWAPGGLRLEAASASALIDDALLERRSELKLHGPTSRYGGLARSQRSLELSEGVEGLYDTLYRMARRMVRRSDEIEPEELVAEAYLRLARAGGEPVGRGQFLTLASKVMRFVMIDRARMNARAKRGGARMTMKLSDLIDAPVETMVDALDLDAAIRDLERIDPQAARIVDLHIFGGLDFSAIAAALGLGRSTVSRLWASALAWLQSRLH